MTHLLSLGTLHTAAPGAVLSVLRGATLPLSREGIDYWSALWADDCLIIWPRGGRAHNSMPWVYGLDDPQDRDHSDLIGWLLNFGLNVADPQVAARLAGLCARALGIVDCRGAYMGQAGCLFAGSRLIARWDQWGRRHIHEIGEAPDLDPETPWEPETLLAALTLALAPRIAGLGGANA